jgi:hypothetical protein
MEHVALCVREVDIPAPIRGLMRAVSFHASHLGGPGKFEDVKLASTVIV